MDPIITNQLGEIEKICRKYYVKTLYIFGSATGKGIDDNSFGPKSDVDLLVEFEPIVYDINSPLSGFHVVRFAREMEELLGRRVDIVDQTALSNKYLIDAIEQQKQLIYAA